MTKCFGHWNLLDDGENEKVWNIEDISKGIFIVTKVSYVKLRKCEDELKQIERILFTDTQVFTKLLTTYLTYNDKLWTYVTYKVSGNCEIYLNVCFTCEGSICFLCKSTYNERFMESFLKNNIGSLISSIDFSSLVDSNGVLTNDKLSVVVQSKGTLHLNEHSNHNALFYTDDDAYCVLTIVPSSEDILKSTHDSLISLCNDLQRFELKKELKGDNTDVDYYDVYNVFSGTDIVGTITNGVRELGNDVCLSMLYYSKSQHFQYLNSLFSISVKEDYSDETD